MIPEESALGKKTEYDALYNPDKLFAIPRQSKRDEIGVPSPLPFYGYDVWNHYEVSWLNEKGKPIVALAEILVDCHSPYIIESKSMKLYFNSFNNTRFSDALTVQAILEKDIGDRVGTSVHVNIIPLPKGFNGVCLDDLDVECKIAAVDPTLLQTAESVVHEILYSDLLKSNCLVTNQPDWGSVQIEYRGKKINHEGLLRYIVSFRNHNEFHEQCIERIFMDILQRCEPHELTVYGRYTRRGGLDINPYRSTKKTTQVINPRLSRQ